MKRKSGFTLAELLIVVAIIGVLTGVGVPVFNSQLEKARQAVDLSNERSATSVAIAEYLTGNYKGEAKFNFDASIGDVTLSVPEGYGKSKQLEHEGKYIQVTINSDYSVNISWSDSNNELPVNNNDDNVIIVPPDIPDVPVDVGGSGKANTNNEKYNEFITIVEELDDIETWPSGEDVLNLGEGEKQIVVLVSGGVYENDDEVVYVATSSNNYEFSKYYYANLDQLSSQYATVKIDENTKFWTSADIIHENGDHLNVARGDVYIDDEGNYYVARDTNHWQNLPPSEGFIKIELGN